MGYAPQFKNDIFVSYRRVSNAGPDRWVDAFCDQLRIQLNELVGDVAIWRDTGKLGDGDLFHDEIAKALDSTAIFLAIISGTYFESAECVGELDRFLGTFKSAADGRQRRIVPVLKQPVGDELPPELGEIDQRQFFEFRPKGSDQFIEYRPDLSEDTARLFASALAALAQDLRRALKTLRGEAQMSAEATIFLAEVGPELRQERVNLTQDLQQRGYRVVPDRPILWNSSAGVQLVQRNLEDAQLCVHLVSTSATLDPKRIQATRKQLDLALDASKRRNAVPLVWFQPLEANAPVNELADYVRRDLANEGVEYAEGSFEDFKSYIYEKLPKKTTTPPDVAVILDEGDVTTSAGLMERLTADLHIEPKRVVLTGTAPKDPAAFARTMDRCPRALILWGAQSEDWLTEVLSLDVLANHAGVGRLGVYIEGPATPEKATFRTSKARIIASASANALAQLAEMLGREAAAR
jgi:TIR domain-containing protein